MLQVAAFKHRATGPICDNILRQEGRNVTNIMDVAEMNARIEAFKTSLASKTDEELFEAYRSIEDAKKRAKIGIGDGESEDLFNKGLQAEAEIIRRHPTEMMLAYHRWLAAQMNQTMLH